MSHLDIIALLAVAIVVLVLANPWIRQHVPEPVRLLIAAVMGGAAVAAITHEEEPETTTLAEATEPEPPTTHTPLPSVIVTVPPEASNGPPPDPADPNYYDEYIRRVDELEPDDTAS